MKIPYLKDFDELVYLMRSSFGGNGKTVMLSRNKKILINPSAKTTLLAWDTNKYVRGFVYEICGEGDGCKTAIFILPIYFSSLLALIYNFKIKNSRKEKISFRRCCAI